MKPGALWPIGIGVALAVLVGANVMLYIVANRGDAAAVEPDYYRRAVDWDSGLADAARSRALGWRLAATLAAPAPAAALELTLTDSALAPVTGARVRVEAFAVAHSTARRDAALAETAPGRYAATLPVARAEWHELRFVAERGGARFTARVRCFPGRSCGAP